MRRSRPARGVSSASSHVGLRAGVFTNEPPFPWQVANVKHFLWKQSLARPATTVPGLLPRPASHCRPHPSLLVLPLLEQAPFTPTSASCASFCSSLRCRRRARTRRAVGRAQHGVGCVSRTCRGPAPGRRRCSTPCMSSTRSPSRWASRWGQTAALAREERTTLTTGTSTTTGTRNSLTDSRLDCSHHPSARHTTAGTPPSTGGTRPTYSCSASGSRQLLLLRLWCRPRLFTAQAVNRLADVLRLPKPVSLSLYNDLPFFHDAAGAFSGAVG